MAKQKTWAIKKENANQAFSEARRMIEPGQDYQLILKKGKARSLDANAQVHVWCKHLSETTGEDVKTTFNRVKRDFGIPIMLDDAEYGKMLAWTLKKWGYYDMQDSHQLKLMDLMPVTRLMSTSQHNQLRDNMQAYYRENGIELNYMG